MKIKVSEATGSALDWLVAKCDGYCLQLDDKVLGPSLVPTEGYLHDEKPLSCFRPSTCWEQGGPIIEREGLSCEPFKGSKSDWRCFELTVGHVYAGPTPLIAAMRCYVAFKLGEEVEVPDELRGAE